MSIVRGQPGPLEAHYQLNGVLTDPAAPRVTIRDPLGVAVVIDAIPTRLSTGIYQYVFTPALDAPLGSTWRAEWQGTVSGQGLSVSEDFTVLPIGGIVPMPSSSFSYNLDTDVGKVRLLTDDRDMSLADSSLPLEQRSVVFTDEEIAYFITQAGGVILAAALALRTIATNRSLLVQRRQIGRTDVDYGTLRRDLLAAAAALEEADRVTPADGYAEIAWNDMTLRQLFVNQAWRELP